MASDRRTTGVLLLAVGGLSIVQWSSTTVGAAASGLPPGDIAPFGWVTSPLYAIELAFIVPVKVSTGVGLLRQRPTLAWPAVALLVLLSLLGLGLTWEAVVVGLLGGTLTPGTAIAGAIFFALRQLMLGISVGRRDRSGLPQEATVAVPLSTLEAVRLTLGRALDKRLNRIGVWLYRPTGGGITRPWKVDALLLTTTGRRTGRERTVVLQFFPDGGAMIVAAASAGATSHPAWYFNLTAEPSARVQVDRRLIAVRAERLAAEEAVAFWPRLLQRAPDYTRCLRATDRTIPLARARMRSAVVQPAER